MTTLLAQVRDRTGYSQSFCRSPLFSKYPCSQWKLLKRDSIKSELCRLDVPFCFPFKAEEEREWKGVNIICSVWGGVVSYCFLLFSLVWLLRLIVRSLELFSCTYQLFRDLGWWCYLCCTCFLRTKLLQFCVIYLEGILPMFSSKKVQACVFRGHC